MKITISAAATIIPPSAMAAVVLSAQGHQAATGKTTRMSPQTMIEAVVKSNTVRKEFIPDQIIAQRPVQEGSIR